MLLKKNKNFKQDNPTVRTLLTDWSKKNSYAYEVLCWQARHKCIHNNSLSFHFKYKFESFKANLCCNFISTLPNFLEKSGYNSSIFNRVFQESCWNWFLRDASESQQAEHLALTFEEQVTLSSRYHHNDLTSLALEPVWNAKYYQQLGEHKSADAPVLILDSA